MASITHRGSQPGLGWKGPQSPPSSNSLSQAGTPSIRPVLYLHSSVMLSSPLSNPIMKTHAHTTCMLKEQPTSVAFWLLTYSAHSHILAGNSREEFGVGSLVQLHIPFGLFLNPLDTLQIPSNSYTQEWAGAGFHFRGVRGTQHQYTSAVLQSIKHLAH